MKKIKVFTATWCGPCKMIKPGLLELKEEGLDIEFIDVDENHDFAVEQGIKAVPTLIYFEEDHELVRYSGFMPKEKIRTIMESL